MVDIVINASQNVTPITVQLTKQQNNVTVTQPTTHTVNQTAPSSTVIVEPEPKEVLQIHTGEPVYLNDLIDVSILEPLIGYVLTYDGTAWVANPINVDVPENLNDLLDVVIPNPVVGQVLRYNGSAWVAQTLNVAEDNWSAFGERSPVFTYSGDLLSRIDYESGNYKTFTYNVDGVLTQLDFVKDGVTYRKSFNYDILYNLLSIDYVEI